MRPRPTRNGDMRPLATTAIGRTREPAGSNRHRPADERSRRKHSCANAWRPPARRGPDHGRLLAVAGERAAETARIVEAIVSVGPGWRSLPWRCSSAVRAGGRTKAIAPRPVGARFDAGEARHAASRRRTAASMNRRPSRALAHGPAAEVGANTSRSLAAAVPPREVPTRVSVGRRDGQRVVDSRGDATLRRPDRDDRCSSNETMLRPTGLRARKCLAKQRGRLSRRDGLYDARSAAAPTVSRGCGNGALPAPGVEIAFLSVEPYREDRGDRAECERPPTRLRSRAANLPGPADTSPATITNITRAARTPALVRELDVGPGVGPISARAAERPKQIPDVVDLLGEAAAAAKLQN